MIKSIVRILNIWSVIRRIYRICIIVLALRGNIIYIPPPFIAKVFVLLVLRVVLIVLL